MECSGDHLGLGMECSGDHLGWVWSIVVITYRGESVAIVPHI